MAERTEKHKLVDEKAQEDTTLYFEPDEEVNEVVRELELGENTIVDQSAPSTYAVTPSLPTSSSQTVQEDNKTNAEDSSGSSDTVVPLEQEQRRNARRRGVNWCGQRRQRRNAFHEQDLPTAAEGLLEAGAQFPPAVLPSQEDRQIAEGMTGIISAFNKTVSNDDKEDDEAEKRRLHEMRMKSYLLTHSDTTPSAATTPIDVTREQARERARLTRVNVRRTEELIADNFVEPTNFEERYRQLGEQLQDVERVLAETTEEHIPEGNEEVNGKE